MFNIVKLSAGHCWNKADYIYIYLKKIGDITSAFGSFLQTVHH